MTERWVNVVPREPIDPDFSTTRGLGSPICIDNDKSIALFMDLLGQISPVLPLAGLNILHDAKGNGTADDRVPIQRAINRGGPILFPPGEYGITSPLRPINGQDLILLAIPGTVTIKSLNPSLAALISNPSTFGQTVGNAAIIGLNFDGGNVRTVFPYATNVGGTYNAATGIQLCANPDAEDSQLLMLNCMFSNFPSLPFVLDHWKAVLVDNIKTLRTKDMGFRFCSNVRVSNLHSKFSADNAISLSRGCRNVVGTNIIAEDCEVAGLWTAGFSVAGTGALTVSGASYAAGATLTMTASGGMLFTIADKYTTMTLDDGLGNTCVVKIIGLTNPTTATVGAVTAVPAGLQNIASASWWRAPMPGVDSFSLSGCLVAGAYSAGIQCGIAPIKGSADGITLLRSGVIADSEVFTTGTIIAGSNQLTLADATDFAATDWLIVRPKTSVQKYFIAKISSKLGNVLTLDRNAPDTYIIEDVYLAHANNTEGWPIYITGNSTGTTTFAENLDFRGITAIDYRANCVQLGSGSGTPVRNLSFNDCTFRDPANIQRSTLEGVEAVFRIAEPTGSLLENIVIRNCRTDFTSSAGKYFVRAYVRGTTRKSIVVEDNYTPNVTETGYFQVLDLDNASADITSTYAYSRIDAFGIRSSSADKASQWIALTAQELIDIAATGILKPRCNRISINPGAALVINSIDWSYLGTTGLSTCHIENASTVNNITFTHSDASIRCPGNVSVVLPPRDYVAISQRNLSVSYIMMN